MAYTNTEPTVVGTDIDQMEPIGFGLMPFGDPSDDTLEKEYGRGFGDPTTKHTEDNDE